MLLGLTSGTDFACKGFLVEGRMRGVVTNFSAMANSVAKTCRAVSMHVRNSALYKHSHEYYCGLYTYC